MTIWWLETYQVLAKISAKIPDLLECECLGQGEWWRCNNHCDNYFQQACMVEQLWAEKVKLA